MSKNLPHDTINEYRSVFRVFDKNGDGKITKEELKKALSSRKVSSSDEDIDRIMGKVDVDGNGEIDFEEFCALMSTPIETLSPEEEMKEAFRVFDTDGDGVISKEELKQVMQQLDPDMSDADIDDMMHEADTNKDGKIDFNEFKRMMSDK